MYKFKYDYTELLDLIKKSRTKRYKLDNNTYAYCDLTGIIHIALHDQRIITLKSDNSFKVSTQGYFTKTTKDRLNKLTNLNIRQIKGLWTYGEFSLEYQDRQWYNT